MGRQCGPAAGRWRGETCRACRRSPSPVLGAACGRANPIQGPAEIAARLAAADCKGLRLEAASLTALQQILHPLGLAIRILGCPLAPAPLNQRVLAVTAVVLDGDKAMDTVRGALGDGELVDMGSGYRPSPWPSHQRPADLETLDDSEVSPDVHSTAAGCAA
jgi:hypothetical protein